MVKIKNINGFIAVFFSLLIITIPFYTADAYAGDISVMRSSGDKNIEGFFDGAGDSWNIEVNANLDGKQVSPDMIDLLFATGIQKFQSCTAVGMPGNYKCSWKLAHTTAEEGRYNVNIRMTDPSTGKQYSDSASITSDIFAPQIEIMGARQSGQNININFRVVDPGYCSGIDKIEFYDGAVLVDSRQVDGSCVYDKSTGELINFPTSGTSQKSVIVKAYDRLGHYSTKTSNTFIIDNTIPSIDESSFSFGNLSGYMPEKPITVEISVIVNEDIGLDYVEADLSYVGLGVEKAACSLISTGRYKCSLGSRRVSLSSSIAVPITAVDVSGNKASTTIIRSFSIDSTAPKIRSITTGNVFNNTIYSGRRAVNITAIIEETESGLTASNVEIDFSGINSRYRYVKASKCEKNSYWECYWNNIIVAYAGEIHAVKAIDNAGNDAFGKENLPTVKIEIDDKAPIINSIVATARGGVYTQQTPLFVGNGFIDIYANLTDFTGVKAFADLSGIVNNGDKRKEGFCEKIGANYICTWNLVGPLKSGYSKGDILFEFMDSVGNSIKQSKTIEIFEAVGETTPNFWIVGDITSMPEAIDRQVTKLANSRMYFSIPLTTSIDNVQTVDISLSNCQGAYISSTRLLNNLLGSTNPYAVIELQAFDSKNITSLPYKCDLNIFSKRGNRVYLLPETKNISFEIKFYNLPLSSVDKNIARLIKKEKDDLKGGWEVIKYMKLFVDYSRMLCILVNSLNNIRILFMTIAHSAGISTTQATVGSLGIGTPSRGLWVSVCLGSQTFSESTSKIAKVIDKFCKFITCRGFFGLKAVEDVQAKMTDAYSKFGGYKALGLNAPHDSIVSAVASLCIPAIIYNLEKYRQIKCRYVYCLQTEVPAGIPVAACKELKNYEECKYWWGEIFQAVPFVGPLIMILNQAKQMVSDPVGSVEMIGTYICRQFCNKTPGIENAWLFCKVFGWMKFVMDLATDIMSLVDQFKTIKQDYCSLMEKAHTQKLEQVQKAKTTK